MFGCCVAPNEQILGSRHRKSRGLSGKNFRPSRRDRSNTSFLFVFCGPVGETVKKSDD
jgi:hypothetical protein